MNLGKIIEELRENAAELKAGIETINNRLDSIEKNMKVSRDSHNKMDKKLDAILSYLRKYRSHRRKEGLFCSCLRTMHI